MPPDPGPRAFPGRGLYALVDVSTLSRRGLDVVAFTRAVLDARPAAVQLRAKGLGARDTLALLRQLAPLCRAAGVLFFANDRPDLALLAGCDGFHVGQEDLPLAEARRVAPGLLAGVSTHGEEQVRAALAAEPSYLAVGPIFSTNSKENPDPVVGLGLLSYATSRARCPVVAIGGISLDRAADVARAGALGAVIGALLPGEGSDLSAVTERARALHRRFLDPS